ncbi:4Fe-4S dicluster domain-containing protein [Romboutsia sp.]|uniref:4Fe-4S dicluster domain-containing protein n=1 Tax=Romboutsia sp. TaxID=1965302 RepID=UPI003F32161D
MDYKLSLEQADNVLKILQENYRVYAPITFKGEGLYSYTDSIRYGEINSFSDVEYKIKSQGSPKEILLPINHALSIESNGQKIDTIKDIDNRNILIILRSCDIHGITRIDKAFMNDEFYRIRRDKVKFMVMECPKSWDTCFCVSLGTNTTDDYSLGIKFATESISIKVKDNEFDKYFNTGYAQENFEIRFATENETKLNIPDLEIWDKEAMDEVKKLELWNEYKSRCIGCGSCNMACLTCTCLSKTKVNYSDNSNLTETRRVWSGCQLVKSSALKNTSMAEVVPARIRQRVLDKFYRPKLSASNEQVCVGCGRCTDVCPRFINFSTTVNKLSEELDNIHTKLGRDK